MLPVDFPWRTVFDRSPVAMSLVDVHGRQLAGNAAYAELLGVPLEELDRIDVGSISRPEDRDFTAAYLTRLVSGDIDEFTTAKRYLRRDGTSVLARLRASTIRDESGACVAVLGVIEPMDTPARVDDVRLRRFLEHAQSTFTVLDANGQVLESSARYQTVLGYPAEFWERRSVFDLLVPESIDAALAFRERLLETPGQPQNVELDVRAADGSTNTLMVHAINLLDDPDVRGVVVSTENVTDERRLVAELAARRATAEGVAEARSNLLATVSHELRNPLHALQGLAELLAAEPLPARAAGLAASLSRQLFGLASVTQDLLDTARLDAGSVQLVIQPCHLSDLAAEVVEFAQIAAGDKPLAIDATVHRGVPTWVEADQPRMRQILRNLVMNAVKFTPSGTVRVDVRATSDGISIAVADTGVGIPENEIDMVLQPFRSASTAGANRGAGLGLAIVQRLVDAMGGRLHVSSVVDVGTTFTVDLPLGAAAAPSWPRAQEGASGATVLVVEDNLVNQRLARSQLEHLSMTAIVVDSGEAAVELMSSPDAPAVDVILMDQQLPGMNGVETARRLRELSPATAAIPVIGLTASASPAERDAFLAAGLDGFVVKPATLADIRTAISEALADRQPVPEQATGDRAAPAEPSPAEPSGDRSAALDDEVLAQLEGEFGDAGVVTDLVDTFLGELPGRGNAVLAALAGGESDAAKRAAHTLKASALLLGAIPLGEMCKMIEREGTADQTAVALLLQRTDEAFKAWRADRGVVETTRRPL